MENGGLGTDTAWHLMPWRFWALMLEVQDGHGIEKLVDGSVFEAQTFWWPIIFVVECYARCYDIDIDIDITFSPIYTVFVLENWGNLQFWCCKLSRLDTLIAVQSSSILAYVGGLQGQFKNGDKSGKGKFTWNTGGSYEVRCLRICASGGVSPLRCIHLCSGWLWCQRHARRRSIPVERWALLYWTMAEDGNMKRGRLAS